MKTLWIYVHASIASLAWLFILVALSFALLDASAGIREDPVFSVISIVLALGHLSGGLYLVHCIREEIREARHGAGSGNPPQRERRVPASS
ncbi:hypothetical protein [Variovorax sp. Sphag1AA]|uniref:hypothetical protein n=1 Tax=Variovorax sp. Sphag1AA TaxID=2587027 RepID=UPI001621549B|nr:hypothetical protein [Variovorax sp. Sphag1AA]MBB3181970.1 hypothetical protein [Variovorax sp. Sphag1AA]